MVGPLIMTHDKINWHDQDFRIDGVKNLGGHRKMDSQASEGILT